MTFYSSVRVKKMDQKYLIQMERHGKRLDSSKDRVNKSKTKTNYKYSDYSDVKNALNLNDNFNNLLDSGVKTYGKSSIGLHMILSVSSDWIKEKGNIHDSKNERNKQLMREAINFAHERFGKNSILGSRMDFDENGGGNIDLFVVPLHQVKQRNTLKTVISPSKSLAFLKKNFGKKGQKEYEVLQDLWAENCQKLDKRIKRGISKSETGAEHVEHRIYNNVAKKIEKEFKNKLEGSSLKKTVNSLYYCKELITDETNKEIKKQVNNERKNITEKYEKKVSSLKSEIEVKQKTINSQQKQLTNTILENTKLNNDYEKINDKLKEKDKILDVIRDYLKNVKDVPKHILTAFQLSTRSEAEPVAGRRFNGPKGP